MSLSLILLLASGVRCNTHDGVGVILATGAARSWPMKSRLNMKPVKIDFVGNIGLI